MENNVKNCVCQSCGMPIKSPEMFGTNHEGMHVEHYCKYCYQHGEFTEDVTMEEMIRLCSRYVSGNSRAIAIANMRVQFPTLKRWAQKEETQHEYHKSINRVLEYIQSHLKENTDLKTLSGIANISPYHFHRIFKSTIGESLAEYVKRLRLEYVAEQLKISELSLEELAERTGYSSEQALSRAFKKHFSLPPSVYKISFFEEKCSEELIPRICKVAEKNVITLNEELKKEEGWQRLYMYALVNQLLTESTESLEVIEDYVFYPYLSTKELIPSTNRITSRTLSGGLYAIFTHKGALEKIPVLYNTIINCWFPSSKYMLVPSMLPYVVYLSNPMTVSQEDFLTEIYIPVIEKR